MMLVPTIRSRVERSLRRRYGEGGRAPAGIDRQIAERFRCTEQWAAHIRRGLFISVEPEYQVGLGVRIDHADDLLAFLRIADRDGYPPTVRDFAAERDISSPSVAHRRLRALEAKGFIEHRERGSARAFVVTRAGRREARRLEAEAAA